MRNQSLLGKMWYLPASFAKILLNRSPLLLTCILILGTQSAANAQVTPNVQGLNAHFVGTWLGTNVYTEKTPSIVLPVRIDITQDPKHPRLRLDYTYSTKSQKGYGRHTRFLQLDPARETAIYHQKGESEILYFTEGLERCADQGYGTFTLTGVVSYRGRPVHYRGTFHIEANTFNYRWEKSPDGVIFSETGEWTMKRPDLPTP